MCEVNLITAAYALEDYRLVDEVWARLKPRLNKLRPYAGSALASYGATLIGRGKYQEAVSVLTNPVGQAPTEGPSDDIALLCSAFCRANLTSALINLGRFEEAELNLNSIALETNIHPVLFNLTCYLRALLCYFQGHPEETLKLLSSLDINRLPLLYRYELYCYFATTFARCGNPEAALKAIAKVEIESLANRKLTRLRLLALAEIASAEGDLERATSYYKDLLALGHVDALAYLRAAALSKQLGRIEEDHLFLEGAIRLDPESHWAEVARGRKLKE